MEAVSPNAFYDSDNRADPPKSHENTRVAVITKIMNWVTSTMDTDTFMHWLCSPAAAPETDAFMLWLYGPASAGKTAIARRVAELCEAQGLLLASFLFFRSDSKRNTMNPLVVNIAYCVSRVIPSTHELIINTIEADPLIFKSSIEVQLKKFVFQPLRLLARQGHFISGKYLRLVVIDGLDECLDQGAQTNLIQFLTSTVDQNQPPPKFLIMSRPEAHIKLAVALASQKTTFSHLELNNDFLPDEDIRRFLTDKFREIKTCHPFRSGIPSFWPSKQQMDELICKASGQFIYASLVVRFINSACNSPMRQLDIILGLRPPINQDLPFAELDALYTFILSCTNNLDLLLQILGVGSVIKMYDFAVEVIESVLCLEYGDVRIYLSPLNSLLEIEEYPVEDDGLDRISLHHTSFTDFLANQERSKGYFIDAPKYHSLIAQWILQVLTSDGPRRGTDKWWFGMVGLLDLVKYLECSIWTLELEHALEVFSLSTFLNWLDYDFDHEIDYEIWYTDFIEMFLHYLECKGKSDLYHRHLLCYMKHLNSSINNPPTREKFRLMSTVCFDETEIQVDLSSNYRLLRHPTTYEGASGKLFSDLDGVMYGHLDETKRLVPEPILSYRLACIALSCMRYLNHQNPNNSPIHGNLLSAWATKSKRLPWLWRHWIRVTLIGYRQPNRNYKEPKYPFPQSLRRSHQSLYSEGIQSEKFYRKRQIFYMWTLDLLLHTLRAAMKSDELTKALSKPFIPTAACILFPLRIKRVQEAMGDYLEKFDPSSLDASGVKQIVRRRTKYRPQRNVVCDSINSKKVLVTDRDVAEQELKRNIDNMLDIVYGPTGGHPKTIASVQALLNRVNKVGREVGTR